MGPLDHRAQTRELRDGSHGVADSMMAGDAVTADWARHGVVAEDIHAGAAEAARRGDDVHLHAQAALHHHLPRPRLHH